MHESILGVPNGVWNLILQNASPDDILQFSYVSKHCHTLGTNENLWRAKLALFSDCKPLNEMLTQPIKGRGKGLQIQRARILRLLTYRAVYNCICWLSTLAFHEMKSFANSYIAYAHLLIKTPLLRERYWSEKNGETYFSNLLSNLIIGTSIEQELTTYAFKQPDVRKIFLEKKTSASSITALASRNKPFAEMLAEDRELLQKACYYGNHFIPLAGVSERTGVTFELPEYGGRIVNGKGIAIEEAETGSSTTSPQGSRL